MPGASVGLSLNFGFLGTVTETPDRIIQRKTVNSASAAIPFGSAVILNNDNTVTLAGSTTTAANFLGIAVAEAKQLATYPSTTNGVGGQYNAYQPADILERGIIAVTCNVGTPTAGGAVYLRVSTHTGISNGVVGGLEATSDGAHTVQLTNCCWNTGAVDANGVAELKIKNINN